eukprot:gb/GECG01004720.1/.p1 GENE.gb/GECG01004720.1/~~gb/GECG01004720.1/.p1  ORF type:complete len:292 (+),score=15.16 gb/GECG01004720.1/:1-876(+)
MEHEESSSTTPTSQDVDTEHNASDTQSYGCTHYRRGAQIVAPCCNKVYTCRMCHDAKESDEQLDIRLAHTVDRHAIQQCICIACGTTQTPRKVCMHCNKVMGKYFCDICNLWDDDDKGQFHCNQCGICRVGGADNYVHCTTCGICLGHEAYNNHTCRERALSVQCPICMEELFASVKPATYGPCGHWMHIDCMTKYIQQLNYKCPYCSKSLLNREQTRRLYRNIEREIERWPLPADAQYDVTVYCNDCQQRSVTPYHPIGLRCQASLAEDGREDSDSTCGSYNTARVDQTH